MNTIKNLDELYAIGAEGLLDALSTLREWHPHTETKLLDVPHAMQHFGVAVRDKWYWIDADGDLRPMNRRRYRGGFVNCTVGAALPPIAAGECAVKVWWDNKVWVYRVV